MKRITSSSLTILLLLINSQARFSAASLARSDAQTSAQQRREPAPSQPDSQKPSTQETDDEVVRITTNLVQIDATVLDKDGKPVPNLGPEDFEIYEDGERREMTNFSFITSEPAAANSSDLERPRRPTDAEKKAAKAAPPIPPARIKPGEARRTVALVIDDLGTSFESVAQVRNSLKKYVDDEMQPGDLVAIIRTSAGMGALQQFTSDKSLLHRAIERIRFYPGGRSGVSAFAPIEADPFAQTRDQLRAASGRERSEEERQRERRQEERRGGEGIDEFREEIFSVGTLGALNFIVRGLRDMPGRKSIVLFSDGFEIFNSEGQSARILESLRRLADLANRASVVIYTIDARGLVYLGLTAADATAGRSPQEVEEQLSNRRDKYFSTQDGMNYLAQQTGGLFVKNTNDLAGGVRQVLEEQKSYYLLGYRPDAETFDPSKGRGRFNKIEVKVKRPGLKVRTRRGFYGFTEEEAAQPARRTRAEHLMGALTSPFGASDVPLKLTSIFSSDGEKQNFISAILHIDASKFEFTKEADGWHKAVFDILALTVGENGNVIDSLDRTETLTARGETYETIRRDGLVFTMRIPVKKHGAYQLRVALRDARNYRVGAANQLVEVPNLGKERVSLSGIYLEGSDWAESARAGAENAKTNPDPQTTAAVRRFKQGDSFDYAFHIYNAKRDRATGTPQLQYQVRLFREGRQVYAGQVQSFNARQEANAKALGAVGRIRLGSELAPGDYVFQVVVFDTLAKEKHRVATQWIDFEIVK